MNEYTEKKLALQAQFVLGTLADYHGQRKNLHGTVKIVGHEKRGGIIVECDGVRALVSPNTLTPVAAARPRGIGKRPEGQQNGHVPTSRRSTRSSAPTAPATIYRNGVPVESTPPTPAPVADLIPVPAPVAVEAVPRQAALRTVKLKGLAPAPPSADACRALLEKWLHKFRVFRSRGNRQAVIDHFELGAWLDRVPTPPTPEHYKMTVYYTAAALLQHPETMSPPAEILARIAHRFPVDAVAVSAHVEWMIAKLNADHEKFLAHRAAIGVDV